MRIAVIIGILLLLSSSIFAQDVSKGWEVGVNYPGLGVKYRMDEKNVVEMKTQFGEDNFVIGPMYSHSFNTKNKAILLAGGGADCLIFKGDSSKDSGWVIRTFVGSEYFVQPHLIISSDINTAFIYLKNKDTSLDENRIDFVLNLGLTHYFGGGK